MLRSLYCAAPLSAQCTPWKLSRTPVQVISRHVARFASKTTLKNTHHEVIFSGIQPTGVPHLGNYLGALRQWVRMQNEAPPSTKLLFCVVDLHALTSRQTPDFRRKCKRDMLAAFLAVGLDPARSILFHQSSVPAHSELHWILSCDASMGWLSRMTQWKTKLGEQDMASLLSPTSNPNQKERMKLGLFSYPVLQSADILVHRATHVPVGEDQLQHVEFARNCASQFNHHFGDKKEILPLPEFRVSPAKRVMSLVEPEKKMSKSHDLARSRIMLDDSPEEIAKKFKVALTDSLPGITYDREQRPGVSNLIEIISHLDDHGRSCEEVVADFENSNLRVLKEHAAEVVSKHLAPMREKYNNLLNEKGGRHLDDIAMEGTRLADKSAQATMKLVRDAIGL